MKHYRINLLLVALSVLLEVQPAAVLPYPGQQAGSVPADKWAVPVRGEQDRPSTEFVLASSNIITVTATGFQPAIITTTFGADVVWANATAVTQTPRAGDCRHGGESVDDQHARPRLVGARRWTVHRLSRPAQHDAYRHV